MKFALVSILILPTAWALVQVVFLAAYRPPWMLDLQAIYPVGVTVGLWLQDATGMWIQPDRVIAIQDAVLAVALTTVGAILLRSFGTVTKAQPLLVFTSLLAPWWAIPYISLTRFEGAFATLLLGYSVCILVRSVVPGTRSFDVALLLVAGVCSVGLQLINAGWPPGFWWEHSGPCLSSLLLLALMIGGIEGAPGRRTMQ